MLTIANVAVPLCGLATAPLLARGLGVDARGATAAGTAPLLFAMAIGTFGLPEALVSRAAAARLVSRSVMKAVLLTLMITSVALVAIVISAAPALAGHNSEIARLIFTAIPFLVPILLLAPIRSMASALALWRLVAVEQVVSAGVRLALVVSLFVTGGLNAFTATLATAIPLVLGGVVYCRLLARRDTWLVSEPARFASLIGFGSRIWVGYLGGILLVRLDQLLLVPLSNERELGLYVVAVTVAELLLVITNAVRDVTFASDAAQGDNRRAAMTGRMAGATCAAVAAVSFALVPFVVPLAFGSEFSAGIPTIGILMLSIVLLTPGSVAGAVLIARGLPGRRSIALVIGAAVNVVLLLLLVPSNGALGAAFATLAGNVVFGVLNLVFLGYWTDARPKSFLIITTSDIRTLAAHGLSATQQIRARAYDRRLRRQVHDGLSKSAKPDRVAGLDVLRGFAVLCVLVRHAVPDLAPGAGIIGVTIFFALSGYLITGLLDRKLSADGVSALPRFFAARAWRLYPPLLSVIAVFLAVGFLTDLTGSTPRSLVATAALGIVYLINLPIYGEVSLSLGHLWTLAVEEQFYLVWPFLLILARRRGNRGRRILAITLAAIIVQTAVAFARSSDPYHDLYTLPTSWFSCLLIGGLAYTYRDRLQKLVTVWAVAVAAIALGLACLLPLRGWLLSYVIGGPLIAMLAVCLVLWSIQFPRIPTWVRPLEALGLISYAVYLWNYPLVNWISGPAAYGIPSPVEGVVAAIAAIVIATASWHLIENPIRRRRTRSLADATSGTNDAISGSTETH